LRGPSGVKDEFLLAASHRTYASWRTLTFPAALRCDRIDAPLRY
jgi:hypothetical protein